MSYQDYKLHYLAFIFIFIGCRHELSSEELKQMRMESYQVSVQAVGNETYWRVYADINDSIKVWAENKLEFYKYFNGDSIDNGVDYRVDSLLCFNRKKNICFTAILRRLTNDDEVGDSIWHFYGFKIDGRWYFFRGASLFLPREFYQEDIHMPLSFEKLNELSMRHVLNSYIRKNKNKGQEINDMFFSHFDRYDAYNCNYTTQAEFDSSWLRTCRENWAKKAE